MKRYAIVWNARRRSEAERYLPQGYEVVYETTEGKLDAAGIEPPYHHSKIHFSEQPVFVIAGRDVAGWTLDAYVIPRYQSGLIVCDEIDLSHPLMKEVPA